MAWDMRLAVYRGAGEQSVLTSVGSQNERWAQIAALQQSRPRQPGQDPGPSFGNIGTATTDLPPISPIAGNTASPLSSDTNFLLMIANGTGQAAGRTAASAVLASPQPGSVQDRTNNAAQPGSQPGLPAGTEDAGSDGIMGSTLVQTLQALVSAGINVASVPAGSPSAGKAGSSGGDSIENTGAAAPSWHNGWDSNAPSPGRQQAGLAAYSSGDFAVQGSAAASVLQGLSV
jgi:hypothetical protein